MNLQDGIMQLTQNAERIQQLVVGVGDEQARWKFDADSWSILEVVNHLYDEEQFDFRVRLDHILHKPGMEPPQIDPQEWVTERAYNERELQPSLENFLAAREKSLEWLRSLDSLDWEAVYTAPWGSIKAGELFAAWVAHDWLHLRQLVELHYAWTVQQMQPYDARYAGEW
jgi:hypothetical protein